MSFFTEIGKNNRETCMEPHKILNGQSNLEKEEQRWRHNTSRFQTILQRYSNQNSIDMKIVT